MPATNSYFTSPATGRLYFINERGLATVVHEEEPEPIMCECELDWNCSLHQGQYTALERQNDAWACQQTEIDVRNGWL